MGITNCLTHGRSEIVETCAHIAALVDNNKCPQGRRVDVFGNLLLCQECFKSLGFQSIVGLLEIPMLERVNDGRMDAYEKAHDALEGTRIFCLHCIEDREREGSR
ncbi:MAG: hypothetical protein J0I19_00775 [Alphaproteobacteria bacterium]|nr:hypothetical protein [Alphaproteobacteria bacterium]